MIQVLTKKAETVEALQNFLYDQNVKHHISLDRDCHCYRISIYTSDKEISDFITYVMSREKGANNEHDHR